MSLSERKEWPLKLKGARSDTASPDFKMLETARLFTEQGAPGRSVLFLAVTAEEKGLVGSEYFAHHPTVPIDRMAGLVNLDMPLLLYDFGDVIAFGAEHSTLGAAGVEAAEVMPTERTPSSHASSTSATPSMRRRIAVTAFFARSTTRRSPTRTRRRCARPATKTST